MGGEAEPEGVKPSRATAMVLALLGPWGIGQFYLGLTRRALAWLLVPIALLVVFAFALPSLGALVGYGSLLALLVGGGVVAWAASLVDLVALPEGRTKRVRGLVVAGFWLAGYALALVVAVAVRGYGVEAFKIPSGSMQPTLLVDDHIMVDKLVLRTRAPKRGEAIVFRDPEHPEQDFLKRVIGSPGDVIEMKQGHPWVNGWEVPHCLVGATSLPDARPGCSGTLEVEFLDVEAYLVFYDACGDNERAQGPYPVGGEQVFVLGDNRNNSFDSRHWFGGRGGGVPLPSVKGRALFRYYSPGQWSRYGTPVRGLLLPDSMAALRSALDKCLATRPSPSQSSPPAVH